jgi:hypothetical protein
MAPIPRSHNAFYAVIMIAAAVVAIGGLLLPDTLATTFAWFSLPPLHARFLGAIYLWGAVFMGGCLLARRRDEVLWGLPLAAIFTGMLFVVSVLNLGSFDLGRAADLIWFASYVIYPIIGVALYVQERRSPPVETALPFAMEARTLPDWARWFLLGQGIVVTVLAVALFLLPGQVARVWPWTVSPFLAQAYSGPLLAYGIASLLYSRLWTWRQVRVLAPAMLAFTAATLAASVRHLGVFGTFDVVDALWFAAFGAATVIVAVMTYRVARDVT